MDWKKIVKSVAPTIGAALGGPMAGAGVNFLSDSLLGRPDATEQDVADYILGASPDQLVQMKKLDFEFKAKMKELEINVFKLEVADRDSARQAHKDSRFPAWLTGGLTLMVGCGAAFLMLEPVPEANSDIIYMLFGQVLTAWVASISYWFGTTKGSSDKNKLMVKK